MANLEGFLSEFAQFESESEVRSLLDGGIPVWEIFRYQVFLKVAQHRGLLQDIGVRVGGGKISRLARMSAEAIRNTTSHNAFLAPKADILIWGHNRRKKEPDGKFWDLYVDPILEHLDAQKCVVMEPPFADPLHFQPAKTEPLFYLDPLYMASVLGSRVPMFVLGSFQKKLIDMLCPRVQKSFGEAAPDLAFYQKRYSRFLLQRKLWAKILNRVQPKVVMMVRAEGNEGLIDVCRERGIPTVELQHGSPSAKKVNYDFGNQRKQLGADHFFAFGEFWKNQEFWARPKDSIHVIGYPYLERFRRKYKDVDKKDRQIVVLSQKALGEPLSRYVAEKMKPVADKVIYKLHPAEVNNWRQVYPWLARSGVQVIEGNEPPLHQLLAESQYQLGVYSTAVYEGIAFGCQTLLLDLPGIEFMEELFGQKTVQKLDPKREFEYPPIEQFDAAQLGAELFAPDWEGNLDRALTKVLRKEDYKPSPGSEPRP